MACSAVCGPWRETVRLRNVKLTFTLKHYPQTRSRRFTMTRLWGASISLLACFLLTTSIVIGQSQLGTGAISGTVQDSNGGVIAGATVTITNSGTGLTRSVTTNEAGQFSVPVLPAGEYSILVEQAGFAKMEQKDLVVNVGGTVTLRIALKPGDVNEIMNVVAETVTDTSKTEESTLINRTQI